MRESEWLDLMQRWNVSLLASATTRRMLPPNAQPGWLGHPGATEEQIRAEEARLKITLPPSYRAFLKVTNGWSVLTHFIWEVWPIQKVDWFRSRHQSIINPWMEYAEEMSDADYFVYSEAQDDLRFRARYLQSALEVSNYTASDGDVILLNPEVITPDGEWEAWSFGTSDPGVTRYRSFGDLMKDEYKVFQEVESMG